MNEILFNLALIDLTTFCTANNLHSDKHGSYLVKDGRGFKYTLLEQETNRKIASVTFNKSSVPTHLIYRSN